jgi:hypothetical protein
MSALIGNLKPVPQKMTLAPFLDSMQALLTNRDVPLLAVISLWQGFLNHDDWLFGLSDRDYDRFMSFADIFLGKEV